MAVLRGSGFLDLPPRFAERGVRDAAQYPSSPVGSVGKTGTGTVFRLTTLPHRPTWARNTCLSPLFPIPLHGTLFIFIVSGCPHRGMSNWLGHSGFTRPPGSPDRGRWSRPWVGFPKPTPSYPHRSRVPPRGMAHCLADPGSPCVRDSASNERLPLALGQWAQSITPKRASVVTAKSASSRSGGRGITPGRDGGPCTA